MVRLEAISTAVLIPPSTMSSSWLASANSCGVARAEQRVGHEHPAEEHHLGHEEQPHADRGRLPLLLRVLEMMGEPVRGLVSGGHTPS